MILVALTAGLNTALSSAETGCLPATASGGPDPGTPIESPRDGERTVHNGDPAIRDALIVLGQAVNPVKVATAAEIREIYARTRGAGLPPAGLNAFRAPDDRSDPNIYVNSDSAVYRGALRKPSALTLLKLAATLLHEQVHNTDRDFAAYRLQSDFVRSRLTNMPRRLQEEARRYLEGLHARASSLARAEELRREWAHRRDGAHITSRCD